MHTHSPESLPLDLERRTDQYISRIDQIDRILAGPLRTLIAEAERADREGPEEGPPRFRQWLSSRDPLDTHTSRVSTSLCVVTLQRFHNLRRRFPALEKEFGTLSRFIRRLSDRYLPVRGTSDAAYFYACCTITDSNVHGILNPFTAAQVFRVLMETGEDHAHSGLGCVSFFAMVWPLFRRNPDNPLDLGARIEPAQPNAYVTAKCLLPLIQLRMMCERRSRITLELANDLSDMGAVLERSAHGKRSRWQFCARLSDLVKHLAELAPISIAAPSFKLAVRELSTEAERIDSETDLAALHRVVLQRMRTSLVALTTKNDELLEDAQVVLKELRSSVVAPLREGTVPRVAGRKLGFWVSVPERSDPSRYTAYAKMMGDAAHEAATLCGHIITALEGASHLELAPYDAPLPELQVSILEALRRLANVNTRVATEVNGPVELQAQWCHGVANREIAFTSADNDTDFDPAELVSSIAVAVRTGRFTTPLQLADAVRKAVLGAQGDGSWRLMHPYYSGDGSQGIRPPAADVVWTLASALSHFPGIDVADDTLFRFVDWLERTQRNIALPEAAPAPGLAKTRSAHGEPPPCVGWSSDQMREEHRVSLLTTAYAANALIAIRDLVEHRLWELCRGRFTVIPHTQGLSAMDPVDLLVPHRHRLHSVLARMTRQTQVAAPDAPYSLVLHGPPGSSKTAVSSALARHLWTSSSHWAQGESRLIRITPADFTRRGEEHVESEAQLIFRLLRKVRGVTILFDEIDDLLRRRESGRPSFLDLVVPAMLNRLQDLHDVCASQEVCFIFGTNYVERIEPALMRKGRIDRVLPVAYPDYESRMAIAERILDPFAFDGFGVRGDAAWERAWTQARVEWCEHIARSTGGWPWSSITGVLKQLRDGLKSAIRVVEAERRPPPDADPTAAPTPVMPADVVTDVAEFAAVVLEQNDPESLVSADYAARLDRHRDSSALRHEVLYSLSAQWENEGPELAQYLKQRIRSFTTEDAVRDQLLGAVQRLPYLDVGA